MAAKIVRQFSKIALLGAPTSAAAMSAGLEGAPSALRSAGLVDRLRKIGYEVIDLGDDGAQLFQPDEASPRARNLKRVLASVESLKPRVEQAVKSAALPLIITGDCSTVLATVAGARRYFRNVSVIYVDSDADLNTPATTPSGCADGMVVSHLTGHGAPELVRFWGEPQLVREPDVTLFGVNRLDPGEEQVLERSTLRRYLSKDVKRLGPAAAAKAAVERIETNGYEFVLHLDVDAISGFTATNYPSSDGLTLDEVREALSVFTQQKHMAAFEIAAYNPAKDPDGSGAKQIIDLIGDVLVARFETLKALAAAEPPAPPKPSAAKRESAAPAAAASEGETVGKTIEPVPGESWSSDDLEPESADPEAGTSREVDDASDEPESSRS